MRPHPNRLALSLLLAAFATPLAAQTAATPAGTEPITPNTLRLAPGVEPPQARLADVAWLTGYWIGSGLGGESEEVWTPPVGDRMTGVFTQRRAGETAFHEILLLVETDGTLELRLRHFNPDLTAWEEKESPGVIFPLVHVEPGRLWLRGLTYERLGDDRLRVYLALRTGDTVREEVFDLRRAAPGR